MNFEDLPSFGRPGAKSGKTVVRRVLMYGYCGRYTGVIRASGMATVSSRGQSMPMRAHPYQSVAGRTLAATLAATHYQRGYAPVMRRGILSSMNDDEYLRLLRLRLAFYACATI